MPGPWPARGSITTTGRLVWSITVPRGGTTAHQGIVHRSGQVVPAQDDLVVEDQHGVDRPRGHLRLLVAGLPEDIEEEERALPKIGRIVGGRPEIGGRAQIRLASSWSRSFGGIRSGRLGVSAL